VFSTLEVFTLNALYKFTFDIDVDQCLNPAKILAAARFAKDGAEAKVLSVTNIYLTGVG